MKENKIIVVINKDGSLNLETKGIKGQKCVSELDALLKDINDINKFTNTAEFFEQDEKEIEKGKIVAGKNNV